MFSPAPAFESSPLSNVFDSIFVGAALSPLELPAPLAGAMGDRLSRQAIQDLTDQIRNRSRAAQTIDDWFPQNIARQTRMAQDFLTGTTAIAGLQSKPTSKKDGGGSSSGIDLVLTKLTVNQTTLEAGDSLTVSVAIANQGTTNAGSSQTGFYLSRDQVLDGTDQLLGTANLGGLRKGQTITQTFGTTLAQDLGAGTYYLIAKADHRSEITESNEANNSGVQFLQINATATDPIPDPESDQGNDVVVNDPEPLLDNWFSQNLQDSGLKLLGSQLGADNFLSRQDMIQLFTNSQDDGVIDGTEWTDLGLILTHGKSLFGMEDHVYNLSSKILNGDTANLKSGIGNLVAGSSSTQMASLVDKWFLGKDRPATKYQYGYAAGSLVVDGFSVDDVKQGDVGNCYFLTSLSSIAVNQSRFLQEMFIDNGDATFTVKFYDPTGNATYVTVDRYLPSNQGKFAYANTGDRLDNNNNELWVALAEKAYAQLAESGWSRPNLYQNSAYNTNSYQAIDTGWMNEAIAALTALKIYNYQFSPTAGLTEANLLTLLNSDRLLTIGFGAGQGLVWDNHAYSINGYDPVNQTFHLDNSWGYGDVNLTFSQLQTLNGRLQYS